MRLARALVRHVYEARAGRLGEGLGCDVLRAAGARRRIAQRRRRAAHQREQLLHAARRHVRREHQHVRHHHDQADRLHVLQRVVGELDEVRRDRLRGVRGDEQRMAIGRRLGGDICGDGVRGAGAVLDDERLLQAVGELVGEHARDDVGAAAGRSADHDAHRLGRVRLRERRAAGHHEAKQDAHQRFLFLRTVLRFSRYL